MRLLPALTLVIGLLPIAAAAETASRMGYPTVASALETLRTKDGIRIFRQGDWTVIEETPDHTLWSFTSEGHPAHPAAVQRKIVEEQGNIFVEMNVLCEASKSACDALVADFNGLNQQIADDMKRAKRAN